MATTVVASLTIGFKAHALIQFPVIFMAGVIGVWLFYIQHQFEGVCWKRHDEWNLITASLHGSSYYKLPKVLQWFTGNSWWVFDRLIPCNCQRSIDFSFIFDDQEPVSRGEVEFIVLSDITVS
jgi:omega-6 fatty acid desaturase (delta-12 desaturase)